jgi:molybdate transport system ATP-binding protein
MDLVHAEEQNEISSILETAIARVDVAYGMTILASPAGAICVAGDLGKVGKPVRLRVRARDVIIATKKPVGMSALNVLAGTITRITGHGPQAMVQLSCNGTPISARITRLSVDTLKLEKGKPVFAIIKTASIDPA